MDYSFEILRFDIR